MFLSAIVLALLVGALAGGGVPRLAELRLKWLWVLGLALALRVAAFAARQWGIDQQLPIGGFFVLDYLLIFVWLWGNWRVPGLQVAAVGIGLNTLAVIFNGGQMPVWTSALHAAGLGPADLGNDPFHFLMSTASVADFVRRRVAQAWRSRRAPARPDASEHSRRTCASRAMPTSPCCGSGSW